MNILLSFGVILLAGLLAAKVLRIVKFPAVTAYLLLGILIGPGVLNLASEQIINASGLISNIVLGIIAFGLGQNFSRQNFSRIGKSIIWISLLEAGGAWAGVFFASFFLLKQPLYLSLLFGAIASATAPAATVMIVREYRARGIFTNTLLGVVALDDAWSLIIFSVSLALAKALRYPLIEDFFLPKIFVLAFSEIGGAFGLGTLIAIAFSYFSRFVKTEADLLIYTLGFVLLTTGMALYLHFPVLLANIFLGVVLVNIRKENIRFFEVFRRVDSPLYLFFFVLAGVHLEINLLGKLGLIGVAYFGFRIAGKLLGASLGGYLSRAPKLVKKYLGFGLIPQAGVALGLALIAKVEFSPLGGIVFTTIMVTTIIYEIIGPFFTKFALSKAGEIEGKRLADSV
ncbi:MAG: cation:proton antiporter [Clostridia bacterium]|jgi:NhaP-type Na+/H+ or K+/H+ antiporter|nr:cation:proton antiporter [Clostridia bacterium]